ncbi:MAG: RNA-binding protein [Bacteroidota bacterium]|jgi:RNA recognition motif-containing protein|nr:RNA-binding protein [Bacteroidota bacterium]HHU01310.1 RNA-binding protein [Bacteroidales bacterium]
MNIFVGSLPFRLAEAELRELFEAYGEVSSARIITDKFSGKSRGFGFVEMPDDAEAQKAIDELNNSQVGGRTIVVNKSVERKEGGGGERRRPSGDQRGGGYGSGGGYHR